MSAFRKAFLSACIAAVMLVFAYCVKERIYIWPFSPHPMYSGIQGRNFGTTLAYGVTPSGEFRLMSTHLKPFSNSMIRAALGSTRGKRRERAISVFKTVYEQRRAKYQDDRFPGELIGLRVYTTRWRIQSGARNKDKPKKRLRAQQVFLPEAMSNALANEKQGTSGAPEYIGVADSDAVIDLGEAGVLQRAGGTVYEKYAAAGVAFEFSVNHPKSPASAPIESIDVEFEAPKGRYYIWLRGKTSGTKKQDEVWLQFNKEIGTKKVRSWQKRRGLGNWRGIYPRGVFAWASAVPGAKPGTVKFKKSGRQRLRMSARRGPVTVDQVWLSRTQKELPLHSAPVRIKANL